MTAELLRPRAAAERFGVSRRTLHRWAEDGRIGRSRDGRRLVWYVAADIAAVQEAGLQPRTVVPFTAPPATSDDWRTTALWRDAVGGAR